MIETERIHHKTFANSHTIIIPTFPLGEPYLKHNRMSNDIFILKHLNANRKKAKSKCILHGKNTHKQSTVNFGKQTHSA
jgi:hypothetical protein